MWIFFDFKRNRYNLRGNYFLKLQNMNTCRYGTQALCFKGILLWNKIPNEYKNLIFLEECKIQIERDNLEIGKFLDFFLKGIVSSENLWFSDGFMMVFRVGAEVDWFWYPFFFSVPITDIQKSLFLMMKLDRMVLYHSPPMEIYIRKSEWVIFL